MRRVRGGPPSPAPGAAQAAAWLCVLILAAGCGSGAGSAVTTQVAAWTSGPLRFLLLPAEERELDRVRTTAALAAFEQRFWQRREAAPGPEPTMRELIEQRAADADRLYSEPDRPGSLSDRGRALLLLGAPGELRALRRPVPVWQVSPEGRPQVGSRQARVEIWGYRGEELPAEVAARLTERLGPSPWELTFLFEGSAVSLSDGGELLDAARYALARATPAEEQRRRSANTP